MKQEYCSFKGCMRKRHSKGLCVAHYSQQRLGKELKPLQVQHHGLSEVDRFNKWHSKQQNGCLLWAGSRKRMVSRPKKDWHGQWRNAKGEIELTHRAAYRLFVGPIPHGKQVLHTCDNPLCVNPEHLYLGTPADNVRDMWERNRANPGVSRGVKHGNAKVNDEIVREIRSSNEPARVFVEKYGITSTTVYDIRNRKIWRHVI